MGKCKFNEDWLKRTDKSGHVVAEWGRKETENEMFCMLCMKIFNISWGFEALEQHVLSKKHKENCKIKLNASQLQLSSVVRQQPIQVTSSSEVGGNNNTHAGFSASAASGKVATQLKKLEVFCVKDKATKAELIWCLKVIASNFAVQPACEHIKEVFEAMFPNAVPNDFSLSRTKARYLICDALAPFFKSEMLKDLDESYYVLCFDETCNTASKKELQVLIRFWSQAKNMVVSTHLQTFFIGKACGEIIASKLNEAMDNANLSRKKLLMLGSDGPNVNKTVQRIINDEVIASGRKKIIDIGTCNIHTVHNAFLKGLSELGENVSDFIFQLHHFFDGWPARWQEYEAIQDKLKVPNHRFLKHVSSRWLTLGPAAERALEQWPAIIEYFTKYLPKSKSVPTCMSYKNIVSFIKRTPAEVELSFTAHSAQTFSPFTALFQRDEPLVHILHQQLSRLIRTLICRICTVKAPTSNDAFATKYYLPLEKIFLETSEQDLIKKLDKTDQIIFLNKVRKHYEAACRHLMAKTSVSNNLLKHLSVLNPKAKKSDDQRSIVKVAQAMPFDFSETELINEYILYNSEKPIIKKDDPHVRVDLYWAKIFENECHSGQKRYPTLEKVVKAALILSHGNAQVERGFSQSGNIMTDERSSTSERTLNSIITVKNCIHYMHENKIENVVITKDLMSLARTAHIRYKQYCEEQKLIKEKEKRIQEEEERLAEEKKNLKRKLEQENISIVTGENNIKKIREEEKFKRETVNR